MGRVVAILCVCWRFDTLINKPGVKVWKEWSIIIHDLFHVIWQIRGHRDGFSNMRMHDKLDRFEVRVVFEHEVCGFKSPSQGRHKNQLKIWNYLDGLTFFALLDTGLVQGRV